MSQVITLEDYRPSPRYDGNPWTNAHIEEGTASVGPWAEIDLIALTPADADPTDPAYRNFTTSAASDTAGYWYRIIFTDGVGGSGLPTVPIQNVTDARPVYATTSELAQLLRVNETQRRAALLRVLRSAAQEIDDEIGATDINSVALPYSDPPAIVIEVNLERAVEHWRQLQSPFGIVGLGDDGTTAYSAKDSWDRHAHKLSVLKGSWGFA